MGGDMLEMMTKMKKIVIFTSVKCYRSASSHPFLVAVLCFFVFLYRSSPFVFSLLVSASPVLICTAVLLGTLLSFGQPNIPEIERDEKTSPDIVSLKTGVLGDTIVVQKNESFSVERYNESTGAVVEQLNGVASSAANRTAELQRVVSIDSSAQQAEEMPQDSEHQGRVVAEEVTKIHVSQCTQKHDINDERLGYGDARTDDEDLEMVHDISPAESFDSERANVDSLDSPPGSPWKHVKEEEQEEQDAEDDEDTDSGSDSDRAESSSPDASMADIMPMLDELHPLLSEDAPHTVPLSRDGSDGASEHSPKSSDSTSDTDDNMEKDDLAEVVDEDNEDADDDEGQEIRDGQTKSAITWTEEDQKNLMDLGTSELERNQRLESLIARRRARKTMSMMAERNLIDLESADLPFSVAPISTARNNPFDLPHDSYHDMGLPPIPGSAPSILLPRRNPFDLPYDSSEEKPDLLADSFQQEFASVLPREAFYRRHDSFSVGPSFFASNRPERHDGRLRPYFVAEKMDSEGTSYSSFQRQLSGLSDSKASSLPETDSVASAGDNEEKHLHDENIPLPGEPLNSVPELEIGDSTGDFDYRNIYEEDVSRELNAISMKDDNTHCKADISQEDELISSIDHVGHGSQPSEETDSSEVGEVEQGDTEVDEVEIRCQQIEMDSGVKTLGFEDTDVSSYLNDNKTQKNFSGEAVKQDGRTSTSSSLSEVSEKMFSDREEKGLSSLELRDAVAEVAGVVIEGSHTSRKEPVYDSSPPAVRNDLCLSFMSPDLQVTAPFDEREVESSRQNMERSTSSDMDGSKLMLLSSYMSVESIDNDFLKFNSSGADQVPSSASRTLVAESMVDHSSGDINSSEDNTVQGDFAGKIGSECLADQSVASVDTDTLLVNSVLPPIVDTMVTPGSNLSPQQEQNSFSIEEVIPVDVPHAGTQSMVEHAVDEEAAFQTELVKGPSFASDTNVGHDAFIITPAEKPISAHSVYAAEERHIAEYEEELVFVDKSVDEASSSREHHGGQVPAVMHEGMIDELRSNENLNIPAAQELVEEVLTNINSPASPESISILSEACESRAPEGFSDVESNSVQEYGNDDHPLEDIKFSLEATDSLDKLLSIGDDDVEEIKEIDDALLSELDAVGDFSIKELGSSSHEMEELDACVEEGSPKSGAVQAVETQSIERIDVKEAELMSPQIVMMHENSEILHPGQVDEASSSRVPVPTNEPLNDKPKVSEAFCSQPALEEATTLESSHREHHHHSLSLTETEAQFTIAEARQKAANLDYNQSHEGDAQSSVRHNSSHDGVCAEKIKDLGQTSAELPMVEAKNLDDYSQKWNEALENSDEKMGQSNSIDKSPAFEENNAHTLRLVHSSATEHGLHDLSNSHDLLDVEVESLEHLDDAKGERENSQKSPST